MDLRMVPPVESPTYGDLSAAARELIRRTARGNVAFRRCAGRSLLERLAGFLAPTETVRRTQQAAHAQPMIVGIAARVTPDDDFVARLQRIARDALAGQRTGAAPLHAPTLHLALVVRRHHMHERMR